MIEVRRHRGRTRAECQQAQDEGGPSAQLRKVPKAQDEGGPSAPAAVMQGRAEELIQELVQERAAELA